MTSPIIAAATGRAPAPPDRPEPMPEHLIRLRGPWWIAAPDQPDAPGHRFPLPTEGPWPAAPTHLLSRRFQAPQYDPDHESVGLRLADVPGLTAVRLNEQPLIIYTEELAPGSARTLDLNGSLRPGSNLLELLVNQSGSAPAGSVWGQVALVIATRGG